MKRLVFACIPLLFAFHLSIHSATQNRRFHPDEAFFITFARNAAVGGDWWLRGSLDKPPLTIYANAVMLMLVGVEPLPNGVLDLDVYKGEFVSRLFSVFMGAVLIAGVMCTARKLFRQASASYLAGLILALSPLLTLYSASAFMDVPMVALAMLSVACALYRKNTLSGVCFILAFSAKPQAVFFLPVIWGTLYYQRLSLVRWLMPVMLGSVVLLGWDLARGQTSVFLLGASNNANVVFYTRYWLIIVPFYALAMGGIFFGYWSINIKKKRHRFSSLRTFKWSALLLWLAVNMLFLRYGLNPNPLFDFYDAPYDCDMSGFGWTCEHAFSGIDELADYLNEKPVATVIYDHWLGWELRYYMGQWTNKRMVYYPSPQAMVQDALTLDEIGTRYFITPTRNFADYGLSSIYSEASESWIMALRKAGFDVQQEARFGDVAVYALTPP